MRYFIDRSLYELEIYLKCRYTYPMKITLLCENASSDVGCLAEWGFSAYIEKDGVRILFDTGYSDVFKKNARKLGIDLETVDYVVLSHFHSDHTGGLRYHSFKEKKKLVLHPHVLEKLPKDQSQGIKERFDIIATDKPFELADGVVFLGQIPRENDFEAGCTPKDPLLDDSALAIKCEKGVVIVSGCSHAGICNISEYAKKVTGQKLYAVIGGFHLFEKDKKAVDGSLEYFSREKPELLLPMHCVDFPTMTKFYTQFGCKKYAAGDTIIC